MHNFVYSVISGNNMVEGIWNGAVSGDAIFQFSNVTDTTIVGNTLLSSNSGNGICPIGILTDSTSGNIEITGNYIAGCGPNDMSFNGAAGMTVLGNRTNSTTISGLGAPYLTYGYDGMQFNPAGTTVWSVNKNGIMGATHIRGSGATPTASACGTSPSMYGGSTDIGGIVTEGTASTGCTVTFAQPYIVTPACVVSSTNGGVLTSYSTTTTALTINHPTASNYTWHYICSGP